MLAFRQVWDVLAYVYNEAPEVVREDATILVWFRLGFARSQALGVRRMADNRSDVVSLARLIDRVRRYPEVLTRERFLAMQGVGEGLGRLAQDWFDGLAGTGDCIDPSIPARDFDYLRAETETVREWVNKSVAHLDVQGRLLEGPPLQAVHDAVDVVADLFGKYNILIVGTTIHSGVLMQPWPYVFRVPWIENDDRFREVLSKMDEAERRRAERHRPAP